MNDSNKATGNSKSPLVFQRKTLMHNVKPNQVNVEEIGFQNSVFNLQNIEHKLGKLGQLHLLLEHILLIRTNLDMDNCKKKHLSLLLPCYHRILLISANIF